MNAVLCFVMALAWASPSACVQHVEYDKLCIHGRPVARSSYVTYGHLPPMPDKIRDHRIPLCLNGPDDPSNVWYEGIAESYRKDELERQKCEAYCRGEITLDAARQFFASGQWKDLVK